MSSALDPLAQVTPDFTPQPREYAIHNASPETVERLFTGVYYTFPGCDTIGPHPARDVQGREIPGTLIIMDAWGQGFDEGDPHYGEEHLVLDAAAVVRHLLGLRVEKQADGKAKLSRFTSRAALSGLSLLPAREHRTPERLAQIFEEGKKRFDAADLDNAQATVSAYMARTEAHTKAGIPMPPPGREYEIAVVKLQKANEDLKRRLGSAAALVEREVDDEDLQFEAYAKARAITLANETAKDIAMTEAQKLQLVENLLHDPKVRLGLRKGWRIREKGFMEPDEAKLVDLAQKGEPIAEEP